MADDQDNLGIANQKTFQTDLRRHDVVVVFGSFYVPNDISSTPSIVSVLILHPIYE